MSAKMALTADARKISSSVTDTSASPRSAFRSEFVGIDVEANSQARASLVDVGEDGFDGRRAENLKLGHGHERVAPLRFPIGVRWYRRRSEFPGACKSG